MIIDDANYVIYGLSKGMQDVLKECLKDLKITHNLESQLRYINEHSSLTDDEKALVIFEFGKIYGSGKC